MSEIIEPSIKMRLQDSLIRELLKRIEDGVASPSDLNVARQLLKDIGVVGLLSEEASTKPTLGLIHALPFRSKKVQ